MATTNFGISNWRKLILVVHRESLIDDAGIVNNEIYVLGERLEQTNCIIELLFVNKQDYTLASRERSRRDY